LNQYEKATGKLGAALDLIPSGYSAKNVPTEVRDEARSKMNEIGEVAKECGQVRDQSSDEKNYDKIADAAEKLLKKYPDLPCARALAGTAYYKASVFAAMKSDCSRAKAYAESGVKIRDEDCVKMLNSIEESKDCTPETFRNWIKGLFNALTRKNK
jgi:tetratricopeptide (TPR) repeat protein